MAQYAIHLFTLIAIYALLAKSYDVIQSHGGMFSICHAAVFGVGAYAFAITTVHGGLPPMVGLGVALLSAGVIGGLVAALTARLAGHFLVVATLGLQYLLIDIAANSPWIGGRNGIPGIPRLSWGGVVAQEVDFALLAALICGLGYAGLLYLLESPWGKSVRAVRDDPISATSIGLDSGAIRVQAMVAGSAAAGVAGALFASFLRFIDPAGFTLEAIYIFVLAMVIVGGSGSRYGPLVGAVIIILLPELLRAVNIGSGMQGALRQLAAGALLVAFILLRPGGVIRDRTLTARPILDRETGPTG